MNYLKPRNKYRLFPALAISLVLLVSCGSEPAAEVATQPTEEENLAPAELDVVACSDEELTSGEGERADPVDRLVETGSWWRIVEFDVEHFDDPEVWTYLPIVAEPVGSPGTTEELNIRLLSRTRALFQFAEADELALFVGLRRAPEGMVEDEEIDGRASITFAQGLDGSPVFGGGCAMRILGGDIVAEYDGEPQDLVDDLISETGEELALLLLPNNLAS